MSTGQFDPVRYKAAQLQDWEASASGWKRWSETIDWQGMQAASDRMVELYGGLVYSELVAFGMAIMPTMHRRVQRR